MACYHPNWMYQTGFVTESGKPEYKFAGPVVNGDQFKDLLNDEGVRIVPCGTCLGCRLDKSRQWTNRLLMEFDHTQKAIFVTMTYNDSHLPLTEDNCDVTLDVEDLKLFWKCIRKKYDCRYYCSGEYGSKTHRPHYHAIIFGISLSDIHDLRFYKYNKIGQPLYNSEWFEKRWKNGYVVISDVSIKTFGYVSRYVLKKVYATDPAHDYYDDHGIKREFAVMSLKPSIGGFYMDEHPDFGIEISNISLSDGLNSYNFPVPKKILEKLSVDNPALHEQLKHDRLELVRSRLNQEIDLIDMDYMQYLQNCEHGILQQIKPLVRNFDKEC